MAFERKTFFAPADRAEREKRRADLREGLQGNARKPKRVIAINPVQVEKVYLSEIGVGPIRYVRTRKLEPQDCADILSDWVGKDDTWLVMVRAPPKPREFYRQKYKSPLMVAETMRVMIGRYRQAWRRPFVYPNLDAIAYGLFERRWPVDRHALSDRIKKEFGIKIGSGIYCPEGCHIALAAAFVTARAWRGAEWRFHYE